MGAAWCLSAALGGLLACAIIAVNGDPRYRGNLKEDVGKSKSLFGNPVADDDARVFSMADDA